MKRRIFQKEAEKVNMLSSQYEQLWQVWTENAMLFHDMGNHLQTIHHLAQTGQNEEICRYIARIGRPVERLASISWTGVGIVDAVLNAKRQLAGERGYEMDINAQMPVNTGIAADDLCTVLTNLLDNAIESMDREKDGLLRTDRGMLPIKVSLRHIHYFLVIRVANPCLEDKAQKNGFFATDKKDRMRHGWGIKSVRHTVRKYNGSLSLETAQGWFVASALLFFKS